MLANRDVAFSPQSDRFVMGSALPFDAARVIGVATGETVCTLEANEQTNVHSVQFSLDGRHIVGFAENDLHFWDATSGRKVRRVVLELPETTMQGFNSGQPGNVTFSPDRRLIAAAYAENGIGLWDVDSGKVLETFVTSFRPSFKHFTPDARGIVFFGSDNAIRFLGLRDPLPSNTGHSQATLSPQEREE